MELSKNKYGYYSVTPLPSETELELYYKKKYYQESRGSYCVEYSNEEIAYFNNKIAQRIYILDSYLERQAEKRSFLDVGCGEGWALSFFKKKGWQVTGLDYSSFGCEKFNPDCQENLFAGNIYDNLSKLIKEQSKFDVIWLDNVLEHVIDPELLINNMKLLVKPGGILVIEVPNDFSVIQEYVSAKNYVDYKYWIVTPDHLSYFNKDGFQNLLQSNGWKSIALVADYPIDWNLLNIDTNYVNDRAKGKSCHKERVEFENLIHTLPMDKVIQFYSAMGELGLGRLLTGYFVIE